MFEKVAEIARRYEELGELLSSPDVIRNPTKIRIYAQERAEIEDLAAAYGEYSRLSSELEDARLMLAEESEPEMREMIGEEIGRLEVRLADAGERLRFLLLPKDPRGERSVIVEIRAGTGGEEAALFAADLFHMYTQYAAKHGWSARVLSTNATGIGGYREIAFEVQAKGAFSRLKYESGVHRVQRVPVTEASGRIHTSTATVAVLPKVDEIEVEIKDADLRVDVFRSRGHGGQSVNTTDSAVRITHLPTGIVVQCQDERSQFQNRGRALSILRARLYDLEYRRQFDEIDEARREQVGSGERSEKIRTYNFPQNRVTDHRIGLSIHRLEDVLAGEIDEIIDQLAASERAERLKTHSL